MIKILINIALTIITTPILLVAVVATYYLLLWAVEMLLKDKGEKKCTKRS